MPKDAKRCNTCEAYQDWRRHFPISDRTVALLAAILGILATLHTGVSYVLNLESRTRFKVAKADDLVIDLQVWNTGQKPSALVGYRLNFGSLPIEEATLRLADAGPDQARNVIFSGKPVSVGVTIPELVLSKPDGGGRYTKAEIKKLLDADKSVPLTLKVDVEESNDAPDSWSSILFGGSAFHTRSDTFPAETVYEFILGRMSG